MAKLIISDAIGFDTGTFINQFQDLHGGSAETTKADDDVWRVSFTGGEAFVRGHDFTYDDGTNVGIADDIIATGDITSFSFNAPDGPPLVRIRGLDDLSGAQVHDALESENPNDAVAVLRTAFKGDDILKGGAMNDTLFGFKGEDKIKGNGGEDFIFGGKGQDKLYAGGDDTVIGDGSADTFAFDNGDSGKNENRADHIYDFVSDQDVINLSQTGGNKSIVHIDHHGGNSYVTLEAHDGHNHMVIEVVGNDHVHKTDISFAFLD